MEASLYHSLQSRNMKKLILAILLTMATTSIQAQDFKFNEVAYTPSQTTFTLFAPNDAKKVVVRIYQDGAGGKAQKTIKMQRSGHELWQATVKGDLLGKFPSCFENVNTNFNVSFTVEDGYQTIEPAEITINVTGNTSTEVYTNTEYVVSGYTLSCSDDLYDETYVRFTGTAEVSGTEVNTYPMGLAPDQFSYDDPNVNANFEVSDGWLEITAPDAVIVTIVGNNTTEDYDGTEHDVSGYTVSISNPAYTEADFTFNGKTMKCVCNTFSASEIGEKVDEEQ